MSSGLPPSGGRIQALLTLLLVLFGPPAALISFAHSLNLPPWGTIILVLVYEILALFVSFLTEVWQKLKAPWIEAIATKIDRGARSALSHYHHHYCRYFRYEYRDLDVKGITTQGVYTLDLEDVFVELRVDPKAPHETSADPLHMPTPPSQVPAELRSGSHTIWEYLVTPYLHDQQFVVLGPPGSGKTTLLKYLGLALIHRKRPRVGQHFWRKLPVLLFLREHSKAIVDKAEYPLADAIRESANRWKYPMPAGWIEHRLARGQCLILLDGLDEVADVAQRQQTVTWVERQMRNYGNNRFVLTSRPFGYRENPLANVTILEVQPLTFQQTTQFVIRWYRANEIKSAVRDDAGVHMKAEQGARDLLRRLQETPDLFDLMVNPLLLTMIATIHRYRGTLPGARVELYKEICEVFLGKRQMARGIAQDLRAEQRQLVLQPLAYEMMLRGVRTLDAQQAEQLIAVPLQQVSTTPPHDFLESIQNTSGLLLEREHGVYSFAHKTFQEYLAAVHINKHGLLPVLMSRVQEEWWHETIRLYCAQADATPFIEACLKSPSTEALILALECEREALSLQTAVQRQVEQVITQGIEGTDSERRRITAEALLARRLRQMYALNEQTFIDTTLVTHAEYQLFLNEMRSQDKNYQPDHWADFTFPAGQGLQPALGVRRSDAQAFCVWLSARMGGVWRYRLPNEKDLAQANQSIWKDLSQDTGYWTEGERRFVWSQGRPSPSLSTDLQATLTRARDLADIRVGDDNHALARDLARHLALTRSLSLASLLALALTRSLAHDRDLALVGALDLDLARAHADALAHTDAHASALDIFVYLFLLQERRARRLPAWEGILLVKVRTLDA
jgi:energy-coupling factor transporter ATP-binding protein EcfA2